MATVGQAAAHIILADRNFYELLDRGVITRQAAGAYDLDVVRAEYIRHLRDVKGGRASADGDKLDLAAERARLSAAQADAQEMKNQALRGELLPRAEVDKAVIGAIASAKSKLLGIPSKIAPLLLGMTSLAEIRDKLADAIHEALAELAATIVAGISPAGGEPGGAGGGAGMAAGVEAAAAADRKPVGRPRKKAVGGSKRRTRPVGDGEE